MKKKIRSFTMDDEVYKLLTELAERNHLSRSSLLTQLILNRKQGDNKIEYVHPHLLKLGE